MVKLETSYLAEDKKILFAAGYVLQSNLMPVAKTEEEECIGVEDVNLKGFSHKVYRIPSQKTWIAKFSCASHVVPSNINPHSYDNEGFVADDQITSLPEVTNIILFTGGIQEDVNRLSNEACNYAVLDYACAHTGSNVTYIHSAKNTSAS